MSEPLELWFWTITDEQARERFGDDVVKVEGSLEVRLSDGARTGNFLKRR